MPVDEPLLAGLMIGGFRSFYGEPQHVGPLSRISVLAGHNNDGKSNVLMAAHRLLPAFRSPRPGEFHSLDYPLPRVRGEAHEGFRFGVAVRARDRAQSLKELTQDRLPDAAALARSPAWFGPHDDGLLWLRWSASPGESTFEPDEAQVAALDESLHSTELDRASSALTSMSGGGRGENARRILRALMQAVPTPETSFVPATRVVRSTGVPTTDKLTLNQFEFSGEGLPDLLLRLQSPAADVHVESRERFDRINEFARKVLDRSDAQIWVPHGSEEVYVGIADNVLPLRNLGSGIEQIVLLAAIAVSQSSTLVCLEEPELHLHPTLVRRLFQFLLEETDNQYLISTHSSTILDDPRVSVLETRHTKATGTTVRAILSPGERSSLTRHLGYRASDLVQANSIVWVEGPSDRIYLKHWFKVLAPDLVEGVHYSTMFYGGRLLSHLTGTDTDPESPSPDFIELLNINRSMAIVIDSDKRASASRINETKERIIAEFRGAGALAWVTEGREIENYVPRERLRQVMATSRGAARETWVEPRNRFSPAFGGLARPDKVELARRLVDGEDVWDELDLHERLGELTRFIRGANSEASPLD